jgi:hypothetical protein
MLQWAQRAHLDLGGGQAQDGVVGEHDLPQQVRRRRHLQPQRPAAWPRRPALCRSDLASA